MTDLKAALVSLGIAACTLPIWAGVLLLCLGEAGIFWFLGSWMFVGFGGWVAAMLVLPEPGTLR
ncbi:MAG TPA: hypothetical protein VM222_06135 [Planctomycetota bacterium]|nr:hypothetical protein [Planctomycetota bacterium]